MGRKEDGTQTGPSTDLDPDGLTGKQRKFVQNYFKTDNATQSYKDAGYKSGTDESAKVCASQLLTNPNVKRALERMRAEVQAKTMTDAQYIVEKLKEQIDCEETPRAVIVSALKVLAQINGMLQQKHIHSGPEGGAIPIKVVAGIDMDKI